ncbi:V0/A0 complex, 116-kDa subunit of ATPase [Tilletiaria anomala UBC 951]|uniref:V-type proton ATPase subunit a n=1 Tax=Tilletiaria anomala (strain ATCC 24038 / CBS 436.72 / UBC 951) TaxID=1037660 RepID=A0A066VVY9_TILAU|nr:V0/A0 complex, 116-kDa subunit of ATPase [Tilletiaria anomala UBC 951]KDN42725.1 V0/A0 complex, 116-kDa subunit of ATPase [Tilletiaria anomala UBC 951]
MTTHVYALARRNGEDESLFRSASMSLIQLYIPAEVAHSTVTELGELGNVQFKDLNPHATAFQRSFVGDIRRLDEMGRRCRFLHAQMEKENVPIRPLESALPFINFASVNGAGGGRGGPQMLDELSVKLREHEERLGQMNGSYDTLQKRLLELEEARHVLRETAVFFEQAEGRHELGRSSTDDANAPLLDDVESGYAAGRGQGEDSGYAGFDLEFVAGTIDRARMATFERILWRVLRGNLYMNYAEIAEPFDDPTKEEPVRKNVFIIFAHGAELLAKIRKISESMGGTLYPIDSNADRREEALREVGSRIEDLNNVLYSTSATRRMELVRIAETLSAWSDIVRREKLVYSTLNLFMNDASRKTLIAEGWCPTAAVGSIQLALRRATENAGTSVPPVLQELRTNAKPPTYHLTNKFTEGFQAIISAYGDASYQEVNPGLFTVITFPFLFAVMFGDIGHGFLMFAAAAVMCIWEKKLAKAGLDEIFDMFFFGRYIILLMGAFSIFTGFLYNDIFSKSLHLFHSGWDWPHQDGLVEAKKLDRVYPIGLDPSWHGTDNNLVFTNSLKMKMSILLGVAHMTFAVCLQIPNHLHFKRPKFIWAEVVPQLLFMWSLFGYLSWAIIYKWSVDWFATDVSGTRLHHNPPGLLNMLIYMFLSPGNVEKENELYSGQAFVQSLLLLVAVVCVPWMLCMKPYLEYKEHQKIKGAGYHAVGADDLDHDGDAADGAGESSAQQGNGTDAGGHGHGEEFELGEVIIHQIIHVIEYCLGCISNTASYLRLWALSLAHAQLSEVLWNMTMKIALPMEGVTGTIMIFIMFALWFNLTIAILCLMEGLSAFLHALRLHWVEAGNKHYMAEGYAFAPFSLAPEATTQ